MNRLLWLFLLLIWILFGTWCCYQKLGAESTTGCECSVWEIADGSFSSKANGHIQFARSSNEVILSADGVKNALKEVADHLKNSKNNLTIVGYYHNNEISRNDKLGDQRAANVKKYMVDDLGVNASKININSVEFNENCYNGDTLERGVRFMFGS